MNKIKYDRLQYILTDMINFAKEDPNTEGFDEAFPYEMKRYIFEIADIFNIPIPYKKGIKSECSHSHQWEIFEECPNSYQYHFLCPQCKNNIPCCICSGLNIMD